MAYDRFKHEQAIMSCWNVVEDLNTVYQAIMEKDNLTNDQLANVVMGMAELYQLKFETLFEQFSQSIDPDSF